ncbi:dihydromonapterin reductase / dihydrofolate reductase [Faunimonas pinastri]|uniref:Dihydromonapterin reductase n=1 Tax=Faunimonas pinastri TaxID=1855383 RepID=A0A1H9CM84_9HYPH|nr:SDR family NAD(P)-dependent oxidoreductase [Faunimonas pinastri]SEQ02279.1 dihydromonapterin reductase / dihydrofolate reductase [Faunimonas pinastri]
MTIAHDLADAILITGAGRRVGLHLARRLLAAGHPVIAHFHTETDETRALERDGALCLQADLTKESDVRTLAARISAAAPSLRAIIHNASAFEITSPDLEAALAQMDRMFAIHVRAPFILNSELAPRLLATTRPHADIIHITDIYADNPNPVFDVYCASKAALQNLSLSFAKKLAPKVKVNVIQPGPILFKEWHGEAIRAKVLAETLLGTEGGVEAIALAAEAILANHYQTAAIIAVDGGRRVG